MFLEAREACGEVQVEAAAAYGMLYMVDVIWDFSSCTTQSIVPPHMYGKPRRFLRLLHPTFSFTDTMRKRRCAYVLICILRGIDQTPYSRGLVTWLALHRR